MSHVEELREALELLNIGMIRPTYADPVTGETITNYANQCLGDTSGEHTPAPEGNVLLGYVAIIHESGSTIDDFALALADLCGGDSTAFDDAVDTRAGFRTELAACTLSWDCPGGEVVLRDPNDADGFVMRPQYLGQGLTVKDYFDKGTDKGKTHHDLAVALRQLVGDSHSDPTLAPDSTAYDTIML